VYITFGNIGVSVLGGLFWFVLAGLLPVDNYGVVNYYIAIANIFFAIGLVGLDSTMICFLAKGIKEIHYQATSLTFISAAIIGSILAFYELSLGLLAISMILFMMTLAETLGKKRYKQYAYLIIGQRIAQIILSVLLYFPFGIIGVLIGYLLGNFIFSIKYIIKAIPKFTLNFSEIKQKRNFALHSYSTNLVHNFTMYLDKILIVPLYGYYLLGLYQLAFQFFMFLSIIPLSLYSYLLPEESSGQNRRTIKILGLLVSVAAATAAIVGFPYIIERFFTNFVDSIPIVRIMSLAIIPATIIAILNATLLGQGRSRAVFTAGLIYIISLVIGLIVLGQIIGSIGLAITLIMAQTMQAIYLLIKRKE
jgi:O-antigen/teichoic acid export membrane protein